MKKNKKSNLLNLIAFILSFLLIIGILSLLIKPIVSFNNEVKELIDNYLKCDECSYDSGKMIIEPTCQNTGSIIYTCKKCGLTKTEELAIVDCNFSFYEHKFATCLESGYKKNKCIYCGKEGETVYLDKLNHTYKFTENLYICIYCDDIHEEIDDGTLISFACLLSNGKYQNFVAEYGMTFDEWLESDYCNAKSLFTVKDNYIYYSGYSIAMLTDVIQAINY